MNSVPIFTEKEYHAFEDGLKMIIL